MFLVLLVVACALSLQVRGADQSPWSIITDDDMCLAHNSSSRSTQSTPATAFVAAVDYVEHFLDSNPVERVVASRFRVV